MPKRRQSYQVKGNSSPVSAPANGAVVATSTTASAAKSVADNAPMPPIAVLSPIAEEMDVCDDGVHRGSKVAEDGNDADDEYDLKGVDDTGDPLQAVGGHSELDQTRSPDENHMVARLEQRIDSESHKRKEYETRTTNVLEKLADKLDLLLLADSSKAAQAARSTPQLASIKRRTAFRPAQPLFTQSKTPAESTLNKDIREHAMFLMNRHTKRDPMPQPASDEDIDLFAKGMHPGPTATRGMFYLDLRGPFTSPWNKRASECFAEGFVRIPGFNCRDANVVRRKFNLHIRTLSTQFDRQEGTFEPSNQDENAADTRARQLAFQRGMACLSFDGLEDQQEILFDILGLDSMSDDERDGVGSHGERRFRIIEQAWKHPDLTYWLRVLDGLYISTRFNEAGKPTPGNWPRIRLPPGPNAPKSNRLPPSGLPRNFFNPKYLAGLYPYQLAKLQVKPPRKLSFPPELIELSNRYRDVSSSSMRPLPPPNNPPSNNPPPNKPVSLAAQLTKTGASRGGSPVAGPSEPSVAAKFKELSRDERFTYVEDRLKRRRTAEDEEGEYFDINANCSDEDMI